MSNVKNRHHYDAVVDTWQQLMGDNFHWGYFRRPEICLTDATNALIDLLAGFVSLSEATRVLDIGCGIGEPATHLHERFGCRVVGISNSPNGIARAQELALERGLETELEFHVRDALANGFPDGSFDVAWLMEMSHLIQDKHALVDEAVRSIRPGGQVALCDLTFNRRPYPKEIVAHLEDHRILKRAFGEAQLLELANYEVIFQRAGLVDIQTLDISLEVFPTLYHWRRNAVKARAMLSDSEDKRLFEEFAQSCEILERFYQDGLWGYGCIVGRHP